MAKKRRNLGLNKRHKSLKKLRNKRQRLIAGTYTKFRKKIQVAIKGNSLLKINRRYISQVICKSVVDKGKNNKTNF